MASYSLKDKSTNHQGLVDYTNVLLKEKDWQFKEMLVRQHAKTIGLQYNQENDLAQNEEGRYLHSEGAINLDTAYSLAVVVELVKEGINRNDLSPFNLFSSAGINLLEQRGISSYLKNNFFDWMSQGYERVKSQPSTKIVVEDQINVSLGYQETVLGMNNDIKPSIALDKTVIPFDLAAQVNELIAQCKPRPEERLALDIWKS